MISDSSPPSKNNHNSFEISASDPQAQAPPDFNQKSQSFHHKSLKFIQKGKESQNQSMLDSINDQNPLQTLKSEEMTSTKSIASPFAQLQISKVSQEIFNSGSFNSKKVFQTALDPKEVLNGLLNIQKSPVRSDHTVSHALPNGSLEYPKEISEGLSTKERFLINEIEKARAKRKMMEEHLNSLNKSIERLKSQERESENPSQTPKQLAPLKTVRRDNNPVALVRRINLEKKQREEKRERKRKETEEKLLEQFRNFRVDFQENFKSEREKRAERIKEEIEFHRKMRAARIEKIKRPKRKENSEKSVSENQEEEMQGNISNEMGSEEISRMRRVEEIKRRVAPQIGQRKYHSPFKVRVVQMDKRSKSEKKNKEEETRQRKLKEKMYSREIREVYKPVSQLANG